jgi:rod shape-determining protein MreD
MYGMILGFIFGFIFDLFSGGFLGASMLSFSVAGFIVGYFYYENKIDTNTSTFLFTIIVFISATIYSFLFSTVANSNTDLNFVYIFVESGFLPGIYTSVFSLPFIIFRSKKGIL